MKPFIVIALCYCAFTADGGSLLVLTEPTARAYASSTFDRWINQIKREGNFSPVTVIELNRWSGNYASNDWAGINAMSNAIARFNPSAVQLFGCLPRLRTGGQELDGHSQRCCTTYNNLACTDLVLTDTLNWTNMGSTDGGLISSAITNNTPGDGSPDQRYGTFGRPVASLDASGLVYFNSTFASGYLAGQNSQPAIDESYWLKCYLTNNINYRQQVFSNANTGQITAGWLNSAAITATNNTVTFTVGSQSYAGSTHRWIYHDSELNLFSPNFVTAGGVWTKALIGVLYKSYGMEDAAGQATYRRLLFPGFAPAPVALISGWAQGANSAQFFWMGRTTDTTIADCIRTSTVRYGGIIDFGMPIAGDLSLPLATITQPPPKRAVVNTLTVH